VTVQRHLWLLGAAARPSTLPGCRWHDQDHDARAQHLRSILRFYHAIESRMSKFI